MDSSFLSAALYWFIFLSKLKLWKLYLYSLTMIRLDRISRLRAQFLLRKPLTLIENIGLLFRCVSYLAREALSSKRCCCVEWEVERLGYRAGRHTWNIKPFEANASGVFCEKLKRLPHSSSHICTFHFPSGNLLCLYLFHLCFVSIKVLNSAKKIMLWSIYRF